MNMKPKIGSNRSFGIVFFIVFLVIAIWPLTSDNSIRIWSVIISFVFLFLGLIKSNLLSPLNKLWFKFGIFLGRFMSPLIMGIIFFIVVTPIGFIMRLFNKDLLNLKFNKDKSYWLKKDKIKSEMKNQF